MARRVPVPEAAPPSRELRIADMELRAFGMAVEPPELAPPYAESVRAEWHRLRATGVSMAERVAAVAAFAEQFGAPCESAWRALETTGGGAHPQIGGPAVTPRPSPREKPCRENARPS